MSHFIRWSYRRKDLPPARLRISLFQGRGLPITEAQIPPFSMTPPVPITLIVPKESPPDEPEDSPIPGPLVSSIEGPLELSGLILGAGTFSNQYNTDDHLSSFAPMRLIRLALRYGIRTFDTSIYYGPSEVVLGNALKMIEAEFPRDSYKLMTKCGRFGATNFDYSPHAIRNSVQQSLQRLQTSYLDTVYLHDIEFVCTPVAPAKTGNHGMALKGQAAAYGLVEGDEAKIHGEGDQKVLDAFAELRKMKEEGLIRNIGITGYPVPTLLRLALLILHTSPFQPVDVILSYSNLTLQNTIFADFTPHFRERAKVAQLVVASPFSMGLLTPSIPPWHPAPPELRAAVTEVRRQTGERFTDLALGYAIKKAHWGIKAPLVVGFSNAKEVHECARVWRDIQENGNSEERVNEEKKAEELIEKSGFMNWCWASP
ncbi:Aldo/keto reductase [Dendrothele bispora CBS 962.96]|uniref:Aldo/keto reductase n=1 Tax=Dendrothele bispora (strain CBS 962.96) TaxID=1314807 RepID=A0A4S8KSZ3_DENBC|nr:Aldo/keto reductase [Dendrothele bispora CBS 962.96]